MDEQKQKRISITLAVLMHAALAAFLLIGLSWKNQEPPPVQAELWLATEAAKAPNPKPEEPRNELAAEPVKPKPEVAPEAPEAKLIPRPPPKVVEPRAADIALQKKKEEEHRKEEAKRLAEERKRQEAKKLAEDKAKREAEQSKKASEQRKLAEEKQMQEEERKKKLAQAEAKKESERKQREAEEEKLAERWRADQIARMQQTAPDSKSRQDATKKGSPQGSREGNSAQGLAAGAGGQGSSLDAGYAARLRAAIRANTVFAQSLTGNPRAEFNVSLSAACEVLQVRLTSSSGNKSWDEAAERAISRTTPFPRPPSGSCPSSMVISHQPKDGSRDGMM